MDTSATTAIDGHPVDATRLADLCQRYGIAELAIFGSVARGDGTDQSDIDLL